MIPLDSDQVGTAPHSDIFLQHLVEILNSCSTLCPSTKRTKCVSLLRVEQRGLTFDTRFWRSRTISTTW